MARLRHLGAIFLLSALASFAQQRPTTVERLTQFIKSAVQFKQPDKQVAETLKTFKMTERLDASAVEDLQGLGAGPQTVAALKLLMTASASLAAPGPPPPPQAVGPPPPSAEEKKAVLAEARQNALEYTEKLPNFICSQITRRQYDPVGNGTWRLSDTINEQLSYVNHMETYKVVTVNNLPTPTLSHEKLGGVTSSGEFATMLYQVFKPETETEFTWDRWATLRNRRMHVYTFHVRQTRSEYTIHDVPSDRTTIAGYNGLVYVDAETKMVMRLKMECEGLEDFPVNKVGLDLNYDNIEIAGNKYVLPLRASIESRAGRESNRNDVEFRLYQKFATGASIVFDVPDEITQEQLEEKPAQPAASPAKAPKGPGK